MAYTIAHGVLGLEGIHRIADRVDINIQTGMPRIEVDRITGLHGLPEADDNREPNYGQTGEQVYPSQVRGKTIVYEGRILARNLVDLRTLMGTFRYATSSNRVFGGQTSFVVRPHPTIGGVTHEFEGRVLALDIDDEQLVGNDAMPTPYQRGYVLTVRQSDPRYFVVGADVSASAASGGTVTVTHPGNAPALPVFLVNGPIPGTLTFDRLDNVIPRAIVYDDVDLASGQQLRLDFKSRTLVRVSDGESFEHKRVFADSNWWNPASQPLNPGDTQIRVTGGSWSVTFAPANW